MSVELPPAVVSADDTPLECKKCAQILPRSKFTDNARQWCVYCIANETAAKRDQTLRLKAQELATSLVNYRGNRIMSTIEDFFEGLDSSIGAQAMAMKMVEALDGLLSKKSYYAAGTLIVQLEKLRFLVQKQHVEEDFTLLNLEQKRSRLQMEIAQMLLEQSGAEGKQELLKYVADAHGIEPGELTSATTLVK